MRTPQTERLGMEAPILQGSLGPWTSVRLTAAVCEAGALRTLGTAHAVATRCARTSAAFAP